MAVSCVEIEEHGSIGNMVGALTDPGVPGALAAMVGGGFLFGLPLMGDLGRRLADRERWVEAMLSFYDSPLAILGAWLSSR